MSFNYLAASLKYYFIDSVEVGMHKLNKYAKNANSLLQAISLWSIKKEGGSFII